MITNDVWRKATVLLGLIIVWGSATVATVHADPYLWAEPIIDPPPPVLINPSLQQGVGSPESDSERLFREYQLPQGTPLAVVLQTPIGTGFSNLNDPIRAAVTQDLYIGPHIMLSKKARLRGHISTLEFPIQGRNAIIGLAFDELTLANGERIPVEAYVKTGRPDHLWGGELTRGTKFKKIRHRVLGIGTYNKAAWVGEREMGKHIEFAPGEHFTIILTEPITIVVPKEPSY